MALRFPSGSYLVICPPPINVRQPSELLIFTHPTMSFLTLASQLQGKVSNRRTRIRSTSGPPAGEWTAALPVDLVFRTVDYLYEGLQCGVDTFKSLTLVCRELKSYCRPMVFEEIYIGSNGGRAHPAINQAVVAAMGIDKDVLEGMLRVVAGYRNPPPPDIEQASFDALHRLAILFKESPDIPSFVKRINVKWIPVANGYKSPGDTARRCQAEALFSFVFNHSFPALENLTADVKGISFKDISPGVQHSFLATLTSPRLSTLYLAINAFPNTVFEHAHNVYAMSLCGTIYDDPTRPQLPFTVDPSVSRPVVVEMCHVPEESLALFMKERTPRLGLDRLKSIRFSTSKGYTLTQDAILRASASSLVGLTLQLDDSSALSKPSLICSLLLLG